jgi:Flp pilus assembly protein TadD
MEQQRGRHAAAAAVFTKGIDHHPNHQPLHMAVGVSLMNLGEYARARDHFRPFVHTPEAARYMAQCRHALERSQRNTRGH